MIFLKKILSSLMWKMFMLKNRVVLRNFEKKYLKIADYRYKNSSIYADFINNKELFEKNLEADFADIANLIKRLTISIETLADKNNIINIAEQRFFALTVANKKKIKEFFKSLYLDLIKIKIYSKKYEMNVDKFKNSEKRYIFEAYLLGFVCAITEYNTILTIVRNITNSDMRNFLDEGEDDFPKNAFSNLEMKLYNRWYFTRLHVFNRYEKKYMERFYKSGQNHYDKEKKLFRYLKLNENIINKFQHEIFKDKTLLDLFERLEWKKVKEYIYPIQVNLFTWIGDARIKRKKQNLISKKQTIEAVSKMEPGDIIVERRNCYLSNIFLGGFWPHGAFFTGNHKDIDNYFKDDAEVIELLQKNNCKLPCEYLQKLYPKKWDLFIKTDNDLSIIEATSEGVIFNKPLNSLQADFVGVIRPRLNKIDKFLAIKDAFYYHGKEYDFDFNFVSENTIVCTELIVKAFGEDKNKKGVSFPITEEYGKKIVKANSIVKKFDIEFETAEQELDFVFYLEGNEKKRKAEFVSCEIFRQSHKNKSKLTT
ncbi:MAG: hypothetical protein M0R46_00315 [Candidatus Muirbacterium halophilum]|nr:hypothetical protein [Candidatus Muirbacterium halophilum]MCK9474336.1 hypothetical protein [Candidatus Muirbacterium halophilum]